VKKSDAERLRKRELEILERLANEHEVRDTPIFDVSNVRYEVSERAHATAWGGAAAVYRLAEEVGLVEAIDERVELLKIHKPYHESDHVLSIALNVMAGGTCLEDLELRRNDAAFMDALGARRIPDPTTAGDFTRRFEDEKTVLDLMEAVNAVRPRIWNTLPLRERREAIVDVDGTLAPTAGECKQGMGVSYNGIWGYHPLFTTLANTREVLYVANRSGNAASQSDAPTWIDRSLDLVEPHADHLWLRGDSAFSLTAHFDRWRRRCSFVFGYDANQAVCDITAELPEDAWEELPHPAKPEPKTGPRAKPDNVKDERVRARGHRDRPG